MDFLQQLASIAATLPDSAIIIFGIYFFYKAFIVGSIYGVIRFGISKWHDVLLARKRQLVEVEVVLDGIMISDNKEAFLAQIRRLAKLGNNIGSEYIHRGSTDLLRNLLDKHIAEEQAKEVNKLK